MKNDKKANEEEQSSSSESDILEIPHSRISPYPYMTSEGCIVTLVSGNPGKAVLTFYQDVVTVVKENLELLDDRKFARRVKETPIVTNLVRLDLGTVIMSETALISLRDVINEQLELMENQRNEQTGKPASI